jgi:hypothetical protein
LKVKIFYYRIWGALKWNPAFLRKVSAAAGGPECPKPHLIPLFSYKPFTGRYGSGSDETQPVKQHSQGGALGMKLLTGPAAVHYRLLVAK